MRYSDDIFLTIFCSNNLDEFYLQSSDSSKDIDFAHQDICAYMHSALPFITYDLARGFFVSTYSFNEFNL